VDGDGNLSRMKAPLNFSIRRFQRGFYTYRKLFWPVPVVRRGFLQHRRVWRMRMRIGTVDSDANSTALKAALDLSIRRFLHSFHTYREVFWLVPVG
jgi:hypothetical protein